MVETYLTSRPQLKAVVVIQDIRRTPKTEESELMAFLAHHGIAGIVVLTKSDKLGRQQQEKQQTSAARALQMDRAGIIRFSAKSRQGKEALWQVLEGYLALPETE